MGLFVCLPVKLLKEKEQVSPADIS